MSLFLASVLNEDVENLIDIHKEEYTYIIGYIPYT